MIKYIHKKKIVWLNKMQWAKGISTTKRQPLLVTQEQKCKCRGSETLSTTKCTTKNRKFVVYISWLRLGVGEKKNYGSWQTIC